MAAFAATASFAQVTLTGNADVGYRNVNVTNNAYKGLSYITHNNSSTSAIFFTVNENLGGGLNAKFFAEADFAPSKNALQNASTTNNGYNYSGAFFNSETYVSLNGDFGDIKAGVPNSPALTAGTMSQPFGTALGGGYSDTFGRQGINANVGINGYSGQATTARIIRHERAVVYTTPVYSGFSGQLEYSPKNNNASAVTTTSTANGTNVAGNNNGLQSVSLKYSQGPVNAMYYTGTLTGAGAAGTISAATLTANGILAGTKVKYDMWAANYTYGNVTGYVGYTKTKSDQSNAPSSTYTDAEDSTSVNYAVKYALTPVVDVMFNTLTRKHNIAEVTTYYANGGNATLTGIGADYKLSKLTNTYFRYEKAANINTLGTTANGYGDQKIIALGLRHQF